MTNPARPLLLFGALSFALAGCESSTDAGRAELYGRWSRTENVLPPVTLEVRREGSAAVGQVWLSGVTYTLPASLDDSSVVLANPSSSALAPFYGVVLKSGQMRATLRGPASELVVELRREK